MTTSDGAPRSLTERVFLELKREVLRSELKPGTIVIESELAERFGVSKTPIREALRLLVQDGWIDVLPRRGYLVRPIGIDDIRQIYELRHIIETAVAATVADRVSPADLLALRGDIADQADAGESIEQSIDASRRFHLRLAQLTNNDRLIRSLESLLDEVERLLRMLPHLVSVMTSNDEIEAHTRLVDALETGSGAEASELMAAHLAQIGESLLGALGGIRQLPADPNPMTPV